MSTLRFTAAATARAAGTPMPTTGRPRGGIRISQITDATTTISAVQETMKRFAAATTISASPTTATALHLNAGHLTEAVASEEETTAETATAVAADVPAEADISAVADKSNIQ